ncbi:MAG: toxic anion resistance protein [Moraxellaceae bacterium]|nr:toxic anion resistance protein [Moraxellaceae bacterium]MCP5178092.1 toxic anion resistance protein [Moraxellaceae bacterium]
MVKTFHQENSQKNQATATEQPKPLFQPNSQAIVDEQSLDLVKNSIARLQLDDHEFSDVEIQRATLLKSTIRIDDVSYITDYGAEASQYSEQILNQLNTITKTDYADGVRKYLSYILAATQKVDIQAISSGKEPSFFARLFGKGGISRKSDFLALERDMRSNITFCQNRLNNLKKTQQVFGELFAKNEQQFKELTVYLLAGQLRLEEEQNLQQATSVAANVFAKQAQLDKEQALSRFERRLQTLKVLRHTVLLRMGQLRLEQKNMLTLIDQANETLNLVVPAWKQQVLALFSLSNSDAQSELYQQLLATQDNLHQQLRLLNTKESS